MLIIDRQKFYSDIRPKLGSLTQSQVDATNAILDFMEKDPALTEVTHMAYMLATVYHETAATMKPIEEYGKGSGRPYGRADSVTGQTYYGRGYVQLTWKINYQKMATLTKQDLVNHPELALEPQTAYLIYTIGMHGGFFTGKKLADYGPFSGSYDYLHARQIINGLDKAPVIAGYATTFQQAIHVIPAATAQSSATAPDSDN